MAEKEEYPEVSSAEQTSKLETIWDYVNSYENKENTKK